MTDPDNPNRKLAGPSKASRWRRWRGLPMILAGCLALAVPFFTGSLGFLMIGLLLAACGVLEMLETFHLPDETRRRSAYLSGVLTVVAGLLLTANPQMIIRALAILLAGLLLVNGAGDRDWLQNRLAAAAKLSSESRFRVGYTAGNRRHTSPRAADD